MRSISWCMRNGRRYSGEHVVRRCLVNHPTALVTLDSCRSESISRNEFLAKRWFRTCRAIFIVVSDWILKVGGGVAVGWPQVRRGLQRPAGQKTPLPSPPASATLSVSTSLLDACHFLPLTTAPTVNWRAGLYVSTNGPFTLYFFFFCLTPTRPVLTLPRLEPIYSDRPNSSSADFRGRYLCAPVDHLRSAVLAVCTTPKLQTALSHTQTRDRPTAHADTGAAAYIRSRQPAVSHRYSVSAPLLLR